MGEVTAMVRQRFGPERWNEMMMNIDAVGMGHESFLLSRAEFGDAQ
jgi:hypothetical protein